LVETYLVSVNPYFVDETDSVPGDNYHQWGWQGDGDIPEKVKDELAVKMNGYNEEIKVHGYTAKLSE
jgi:hypothetical protein